MGGRGILMVHRMIQAMRYRRAPTVNALALVLPRARS